jgi:hypothetical protein
LGKDEQVQDKQKVIEGRRNPFAEEAQSSTTQVIAACGTCF